MFGARLIVVYSPPKGGRMTDREAEKAKERILSDVCERSPGSVKSADIRIMHGDIEWPWGETILVSNHLQNHERIPVWRPASEAAVRNAKAPIFVPFGNKPELECGYIWGVRLAQSIRTRVIFYHATWPRDGVTSENGKDHWHAGAEEVARRAERYAEEMGVPSETVVERAPSIREGVHQAALSRCALCIVAQQDINVIAGGYHDELVRYGHLVPLIILPKGGLS